MTYLHVFWSCLIVVIFVFSEKRGTIWVITHLEAIMFAVAIVTDHNSRCTNIL